MIQKTICKAFHATRNASMCQVDVGPLGAVCKQGGKSKDFCKEGIWGCMYVCWGENNLMRTESCLSSNADAGIASVQKKSLEKEELCQRLKEQLDALEKETAAKLAEMDAFNSQLKVRVFSDCLQWVYFFIHVERLLALPKGLPNFQCHKRMTRSLVAQEKFI